MKKTKLLGLGLSTLLLAIGATGCAIQDSASDEDLEYNCDDSKHWLEDANGNRKKKEDHTFEAYGGDSRHKNKEATCGQPGVKLEKCTVCGHVKEIAIPAPTHHYEENITKYVAPTCGQPGKRVMECENCGDEKPETVPATNNHTLGAATTISSYVDGTSSAVSKKECTVCGQADIIVDAIKYCAISGSIKTSGPANTLKLNANEDFVTYKFNLDKAFTGKVYIMGQVDYWHDDNNNNQNRSFFDRKSGEGANVEVKINDKAVTITNTKTYEQMGMAAGETIDSIPYSTLALCELGDASLNAGMNTVTYKRVDSYNLNITEIHFIGNFAA